MLYKETFDISFLLLVRNSWTEQNRTELTLCGQNGEILKSNLALCIYINH